MPFHPYKKAPTRVILIAITIGFMLFSAGCSRLVYFMHAASGQFRLLYHAIPVEEALKTDTLNSVKKERLRLVAQIKDFGEKELGLKKTRNYQTINLKSPLSPIYVVSASPKDKLARITWWFPVVGRMPYLGFFDLDSAMVEKENLLQQDLDVATGRGDAYSTLGWFEDPVTLNLLHGSTVDLVETILHEMTHTTFYAKGQGEFNEGLAQLVGKFGTLFFFRERYGRTHPLTIEAQKSIEDERLFSSFLADLLSELQGLYGSNISREEKLIKREHVFSSYRRRFRDMKSQFQTDHLLGFSKADLNNAYLMAIGLYHRHFRLFEAILKRHGNSIKETLLFFQNLSDERGDMLKKAKKWLERPLADSGRLTNSVERSLINMSSRLKGEIF
ncbi:MAG: aminopeptidase [Pseudomonadota bacterium]